MPTFDTLLQIKNEILQKGTSEEYNKLFYQAKLLNLMAVFL